MIRVLHAAGPEEARRRIDFLGAAPGDAVVLCTDLRPYLLSVPEGETARGLGEILARRGVPSARAGGRLLFSLSSAEQVSAWIRERPEDGAALEFPRDAIIRYRSGVSAIDCRGRELLLGGIPKIMGILNVTPDSFSDGGKFATFEAAVGHGIAMADAGAEIVDVGGESTRPGSSPVPAEEEIARVVPVIRELSRQVGALISIDTTKASVAREAVAAGACIVNDTSALADDPEMAGFAAESGCAVVLMHRRGKPATMQEAPSYESLFDDMLGELSESMEAAVSAGVERDRILVDPGIGFGKRLEDNLALHRHLPDLRNLGRPIVFGPSRKSFIGKVTGKGPEGRVYGTAAAVAIAAFQGADILRVHDVAEMADAVRVAHAVREGQEC